MIHVEDHHLGGAARLAAALDHAGERVEALHEADRAGGDAAAGKRFVAAAQRGEIRARARAPLEEHALGLGQVHDRFHVVLHGVDEAGRALRLGLHADVEPHRRIEGHLLLDQQVRQLVAESVARFGAWRSSRPPRPSATMVSTTRPISWRTELSRSGVFELAVKIFRGDDVGRRLRPGLGHFHVFLAENHLALFVADQRRAPFPFDRVEGMHLAVGERRWNSRPVARRVVCSVCKILNSRPFLFPPSSASARQSCLPLEAGRRVICRDAAGRDAKRPLYSQPGPRILLRVSAIHELHGIRASQSGRFDPRKGPLQTEKARKAQLSRVSKGAVVSSASFRLFS